MSDLAEVLAQQKMIREQISAQSAAIDKIADAMADLAKTMARSEEKHIAHADGLKRIGGQIDRVARRVEEMDRRIDQLEIEQAKSGMVTGGAVRVIERVAGWLAIGLLALMIGSKTVG